MEDFCHFWARILADSPHGGEVSAKIASQAEDFSHLGLDQSRKQRLQQPVQLPVELRQEVLVKCDLTSLYQMITMFLPYREVAQSPAFLLSYMEKRSVRIEDGENCYHYEVDGIWHGPTCSFSPPFYEEGTFINGKEEGKFLLKHHIYPEELSGHCTYKEGLLHGTYESKELFRQFGLRECGEYDRGKKIGMWNVYHMGSLHHQVPYRLGKKHGIERYYHSESTEIYQEITYSHGSQLSRRSYFPLPKIAKRRKAAISAREKIRLICGRKKR